MRGSPPDAEKPPTARRGPGRLYAVLGFVAVVALVLWWSGTRPPAAPSATILTLYGFSAIEDVLEDEVLPAFQADWEARTGRPVEFVATWAGSAQLVDRILRRVPVHVALLSSRLDRERLERRGLALPRARGADPSADVLARSPLVFAVRPGNPHAIEGWHDLIEPGLGIVHPDPATSGAGEWGLVSAWGQAERRLGDSGATAELVAIWRNVTRRPSCAARALAEFTAGHGDVLVAWESQVLAAQRAGTFPGEIVYPPVTGIAEHLVVEIPRNVPPEEREVIDALLAHLFSEETRATLERSGFRVAGAAPTADDFTPLRLEDLGGSRRIERDILGEAWRTVTRTVTGEERAGPAS
jgi:sulfate transport system substrate-binding protein